jgi:hypothetical protein
MQARHRAIAAKSPWAYEETEITLCEFMLEHGMASGPAVRIAKCVRDQAEARTRISQA